MSSAVPVGERIAVEPRCFDTNLSADRAEARTRSGVAFDLERQRARRRVHYRDMFMDVDNAGCRRRAIGGDETPHKRFMECELIAGMEYRTLARFHVAPDARANQAQHDRHEHGAEMPGV